MNFRHYYQTDYRFNYSKTLPDYGNSILNIPNSILKYFGAKPHHATLPVLDERLSRRYKNVVLLILDGFGAYYLNDVIPGGFLAGHKVSELTSVCPSTTAAAINTFLSGLSPIETGYLGWNAYFREIGKSVELFTGYEYYSDDHVIDIERHLGYDTVQSQISRINKEIITIYIPENGVSPSATCEGICDRIAEICDQDGEKYIYAYHAQPDRNEHLFGCMSENILALVRDFDRTIERLASRLKDTLLIVTADHGLVDTSCYMISDYPGIEEMLVIPPQRECRNVSFYVKDECKNCFAERFYDTFGGDDFVLMTKAEAVKRNLFGLGRMHKMADEFLGDFIAFSVRDKCIWYDKDGRFHDYIGHHAGLSRDEMVVPLCLIET
jgi:hypothetical protein